MLNRLVISDVVLIDKLALDLEPGLNVFTGETGAGKSILLDALALACGARSEAGLIRAGAAQASVTAEFSLPKNHAAFALAEAQGLSANDPLLLRRTVGKDGKSRAFINDQPVSIGLLKQFGESLLEIHGQFEAHGLLDPATHRGLLDAYAESPSPSGGRGRGGGSEAQDPPPLSSPQGGRKCAFGKPRKETAETFAAWKDADQKQREAATLRDRAAQEEEFLRAAAVELDELAPAAGEAETLAARRTQLQSREKITEALQAAEHALGERGAESSLAQAGKAVARIADKAPELAALLAAIDRAANETAEAAQQLERCMASLDAEPDALQRIEERLFALRASARKHNVQVDDLAKVRADLAAKLALISGGRDQLTTLAKAATEARHAYIKRAEDLGAKRRQAATQLMKAMDRELPPLKLERARFVIDVAALPEEQWTAEGQDRVTFKAATNPGTEPGPLHKIASGGELARFMLALKVVLAAADPVPVLVFDEVDAGIGGAVASAVGERLAKLAEHVQVLVVTHSPQVAARADYHLCVAKQVKAKQAITAVEILDDAARREEIARMLAGTQVTDAARKAASSLIEDSGLPVQRKRAAQK